MSKKQIPITVDFDNERLIGWIAVDPKMEGMLTTGYVLRPAIYTTEPEKGNQLQSLSLVFDRELSEKIKKSSNAL